MTSKEARQARDMASSPQGASGSNEPTDEQLANFMAVRMFGPAGMSEAPLIRRLMERWPEARERALEQHREFQAAIEAIPESSPDV